MYKFVCTCMDICICKYTYMCVSMHIYICICIADYKLYSVQYA